MTSTSDNKIGIGIADIVRRIWARDCSIWPEPSPGGGGDWMGWLDLPASLGSGIGFANRAHLEALDGITSFNVLGMGGSSLTPEVLSSVFPDTVPKLNVFDTVNPATISNALKTMDLSTAAFAVASKSGTTVEPLSLESVFRAALSDAGVTNAADRFVALSDPGTPLAQRADDGEFAIHIPTPTNVGGRYSALSGFGMFPASICGMPTDDMTHSAMAMADRCRREDGSNPGVELGFFMAANALRGRDKVTFAMSPSLERFGLWLEQLLAESTGKNGRGLIPVAGETVLPEQSYGNDRQFVCIALEGEEVPYNPAHDDHPTFRIDVPDRASIAGEFFRWEFATIVAACAIGVYPFDQPDVEAAKLLAREALESSSETNQVPADLASAIQSIVSNGNEGGYVAIVAYLPESHELTNEVSALRVAVSNATGMATTFGYGPRYLHSTGQLHKGGPNSIQLIAITQSIDADVAVPGQTYSLGDLLHSQAIGDVRACRENGRRAEFVQIDGNVIAELKAVAAKIN